MKMEGVLKCYIYAKVWYIEILTICISYLNLLRIKKCVAWTKALMLFISNVYWLVMEKKSRYSLHEYFLLQFDQNQYLYTIENTYIYI